MQRYSFKVDGEYRRPTPDDAGAFYDVAIVDARIAELEALRESLQNRWASRPLSSEDAERRIAELEALARESLYFMAEEFPPMPASELTLDQCCVTPRYFAHYQALHKALGL